MLYTRAYFLQNLIFFKTYLSIILQETIFTMRKLRIAVKCAEVAIFFCTVRPALSRVVRFCSLHAVTLSVIYYSTHENVIHLLNST